MQVDSLPAEPQGTSPVLQRGQNNSMNDACVTTLCLTSNFESWVLYKPSVSIAISFIMQNLCMYDLIQYFGKKNSTISSQLLKSILKNSSPPTFSLLGPSLTEPFFLLLVSTVITLSNPFSRLPNTLVPFLFGVSSTCTWLRLSSTERHLRGKKPKTS